MRVGDLMTPNVQTCTPDMPLQDVAVMMITNDCGLIPVCDNPNDCRVMGVITDRDIVVRLVAEVRVAGASILAKQKDARCAHGAHRCRGGCLAGWASGAAAFPEVTRAPALDRERIGKKSVNNNTKPGERAGRKNGNRRQ